MDKGKWIVNRIPGRIKFQYIVVRWSEHGKQRTDHYTDDKGGLIVFDTHEQAQAYANELNGENDG